MPKRGHNCPDTLENVHFAIVDSPTPPSASVTSTSTASSATPKPTFSGAPSPNSFEDSNRETLLMHLTSLQEENVRLMQENARLHEMCQFQAQALHSIHPEFARPANTAPLALRPNSGPVNAFPIAPQHPAFAQPPFMTHSPPNALPNAFPPPVVPQSSVPPPITVSSAHSSISQPPTMQLPQSSQLYHPAPITAHPADKHLPPAKRPKVEESYVLGNHFVTHSPFPVPVPFPPEHMGEMHGHYHQRPMSVRGHPYDFEYERNE